MSYVLLFYKGKRPNNSKSQVKKELMDYIRAEYKRGHIPSKRELQRNFKLKIEESIDFLYKEAGLTYKITANQEIKSRKAQLLLEIVIENIGNLGLRLVKYRNIRERGIDIIATDGKDKVGIELKAYNKFEKFKSRDLKQVESFIRKESLDKAIIITTTDLCDHNLNLRGDIRLIRGGELMKTLKIEDTHNLDFILDHSVNQEDISKKLKREKILNYVLNKYLKEKIKPGYNEILKELNLDLYSYFKSLFEIYKILDLVPPLRNMGGKRAKIPDIALINLWKEEFKKYILRIIKNEKRYPSGKELEKHFNISNIRNIVNMSVLYQELNLPVYLERRKSTSAPNV
ncbi:MAG: restriction endonuclease [Nanoarchaeota archaeon]